MEQVDLPDNAIFVLDDINGPINEVDGYADICHARDISLAVSFQFFILVLIIKPSI